MFSNRYFEFDEPIHWFMKIGSSASNTYVGRSRSYDTVHRLTSIEPGDQVHALVGGTFLVRKDGAVEEGCFRLPKHIFEKSYGPHDSDATFLGRVAETGRCREIGADVAAKADYGALRRAGYPDLPPLMGQLAEDSIKASPLLVTLMETAQDIGLQESAAIAGGKLFRREVGESTECALIIEVPDRKAVEISMSPDTRDIWIRDGNKDFAPAVREACKAGCTLEPEFRNDVVTIFPGTDLHGVMEAVASFVTDEQVYAPAAHDTRR